MERPSAEPTSRRRAGAVGALSLVVAVLCVVGALRQREDAALPAGVAESVLAARAPIDGAPVEDAAVLDLLVRGRGVGGEVDTGPAAGVVRTVRDVPDAVVAVTLASALAYLAVAFAVLGPRRGRRGVGHLFVAFLAAAVLIAVGGASLGRGPAGAVLSLAFLAAFAVLPTAFLASTLQFPGAPLVGARIATSALLLAAAFLLARVALTFVPALVEGAPLNRAAAASTTALLGGWFVAGLAAGLLVLGWRVVRSGSALERRQAGWILGGVAVGAAPYAFLRLVPRLLWGSEPPISPAVDRVLETAVPLAFAAAVARDRLLDIDLIRRRGWVHAAVALAVAAAAFGLLRAGAALLPAAAAEWGGALAIALPAAALAPLRRRLAPLLDRRLFGIDAERERALEGLAALLGALDAVEDVGRTARGVLELHLDAHPVVVALDAGGPAPAGGGRDGAASALLDSSAPAPPGIVHVARARAPDGARAAVGLGPKRGGRGFALEDESFAQRVAQAAAEAAERVALRRRLLAEEAARAADAELARRKADFFARVAHDLRTPVASIRWSVRNLEDGVVGALAPAQREYVGAVSAAAAQLARLVDHLVEIGRLDLGAGLAPGDRVRWDAVAGEVAAVLRPVAAARGVRIDLAVEGALPAVAGRADGAARVLQNLLDNAVKHAPGGTGVEVRVAPAPDGGVLVAVRDHGPGLPPGDPERLFDLFTRGPERGGAPGFGIGLHVVRAWTRAMGGQVRAGNAADGGAVFECRFPPAPEGRP